MSRHRSESWLESPLRTPVGEIELAGRLTNVSGLDPKNMRVLRRFALVLTAAGRGYYCDARGARMDLERGDVVVVFPELAHAYGPLPGTGWTQIYIVFDGPQFELWREQGLLSPERPVMRLGGADPWRRRLREVVKAERPHSSGAPLRAMGRLSHLLADMIASDTNASRRAGHDAWLDRTLLLLGRRGPSGWPAPQEVAPKVGLSYENFRKQFVALTGESPGRYQKRRRLESACASLFQGDASLKEIAESLGFCDVFHFSKAFKRQFGSTPSEYRRRVCG